MMLALSSAWGCYEDQTRWNAFPEVNACSPDLLSQVTLFALLPLIAFPRHYLWSSHSSLSISPPLSSSPFFPPRPATHFSSLSISSLLETHFHYYTQNNIYSKDFWTLLSHLTFLPSSSFILPVCLWIFHLWDPFLSLAHTQYIKNTTYSLERYWWKSYCILRSWACMLFPPKMSSSVGLPFPSSWSYPYPGHSITQGASWLSGCCAPCSLSLPLVLFSFVSP